MCKTINRFLDWFGTHCEECFRCVCCFDDDGTNGEYAEYDKL